MELFVIIVNDWLKPLAIITKSSTLDVAVVLNPPLGTVIISSFAVTSIFKSFVFL